MKKKKGYTLAQAVRLSGSSQRSIIRYTAEGWLPNRRQYVNGRQRRVFTEEDIETIKRIAHEQMQILRPELRAALMRRKARGQQ